MNLKDIIYEIYGREITRNLLDINGKTQDITMNGYIGRPCYICREIGHMKIILSMEDI